MGVVVVDGVLVWDSVVVTEGSPESALFGAVLDSARHAIAKARRTYTSGDFMSVSLTDGGTRLVS